jgi:hypothetical protein
MDERIERCENCRFWFLDKPTNTPLDLIRECRRYPRQLYVYDDSLSDAWPKTADFHWCGEWKPKPPDDE